MDRFEYLGKGWMYPFRFTEGNVEVAKYLDSVRANIRFLLDTRRGELFMNPNTGSRLYLLTFRRVDDDGVFEALATEYAREAVLEQDSRVSDLEVEVVVDQNNENKVTLRLTYYVIEADIVDTFDYLFFLEEVAEHWMI